MSNMLSTESTFAVPFLERVGRDRPGWADEKLLAWDAMAFRQAENFIIRHYWTKQGSINVFRITGTDHPQYAGMSWAELLDRGKRMDINIPLLEKNPAYYTDALQTHAGMSFVSLDGINWYVSTDGNHRSCLARFYFHVQHEEQSQLHNVSLSQYETDWSFHHASRDIAEWVAIFNQSGKGFSRLDIQRTATGREDGPGWMMDRFQTQLTVTVHHDGGHASETVIRSASGALHWLQENPLVNLMRAGAGKKRRWPLLDTLLRR